MTVSVFRRIGLFVVFALMPLMMASGGEAQQSTDPETVRIEKIIRNYLLEHPELLVEVMRKLEARQKAEEEAGMAGKIQANRDALFASHDDFIANPMGKFPVVEFFDYQCGYCKRFLPTMARLLETDKSVRFVFKEFPILGEVSVTASKAALAAKMQGKYRIFHDTVMGLRRRLTEAADRGIGHDLCQITERGAICCGLAGIQHGDGLFRTDPAGRALATAFMGEKPHQISHHGGDIVVLRQHDQGSGADQATVRFQGAKVH